MTKVYKFLHGYVDFQASDVGLHVAASSTRGAGVHLTLRRARNCVFANLLPLPVAIRLEVNFNTHSKFTE